MVVRSTVSKAIRSSVRSTLGSGGGAGGGGGPALTLDNVTSAVLAFSYARKLRTAYSGSLIRVRRASDSVELDIGAAANVLDESALTTHTGASDGFVATLYDQSGHASAVNFVQATTTVQPCIALAGVVTKVGGKVAADTLIGASAKGVGTNAWGTRPSSAVMLAVVRGQNNLGYLVAGISGSTHLGYATTSASTSVSSNSGSGQVFSKNGASIGTQGTITRQTLLDEQDAVNLMLAEVSNVNFSNAAWTNIRTHAAFGSSSFGWNDFAELIILASPTADELNAVRADMAAFYGITLS